MEDFKLNNGEDFYVSLILEDMGGTISAADARKLSEWRSLNKENNALYYELFEVEENLSLLKSYNSLNVDDSLAKLHQKLEVPQTNKSKEKVIVMKWMAIAACLAFVLFGVFYISYKNDKVVLETAALQSKTYILPDGSKLTLNGETLVSFSERNFKRERTLDLIKGECFFEVIHNEKSPFLVRYEGLTIKDIGTAFNVQLTKRLVRVIVNEGKVQMATENEPDGTFLAAGESASFSFDEGRIEKSVSYDANYKAYVDHKFYFANTSLADVIIALSKGFHQKIILTKGSLKDKRLTAEFKNEKLDDIILVISKSLNVTATKTQGVIYISE